VRLLGIESECILLNERADELARDAIAESRARRTAKANRLREKAIPRRGF